ncbi:glutathione synthase [Betaproteobacteria bacterium GR16-43]|nr:glutathione synthase [Betaproteobacteria bacterium GR16-43]
MRFAFVVDPLVDLKAYKDSSVAMMREAARRGHEVHAFEARGMLLESGSVTAPVSRLELAPGNEAWYRASAPQRVKVSSFDVVMMRKDPPFDQEYYYATLLLDRVEAEGARVVNKPRALRDWNEKLAILRFPKFTPETLVASDPDAIQAFIAKHGDVIVKKLDGMGGTMIFRVRDNDVNRNVIVETMTDLGTRTVMAQRFVPDISRGDKRVLVIGGKVFDHCLARIPKAGETRGNLAAGGTGVAQPISERDREIAEGVGRELVKDGIVFAGLDVIGDYLTEVNVTSPTGIVEIAQQTGHDAAKVLFDALE